MRVDHRFFSVNGLRLHALHYGGEGHPILLVHGVTGHGWLWSDVAGQLTLWGQVLAVDLRGHGDSQWSPDGDYDSTVLADDLAAIIEQFEEPADVVGLSWGGLVAIRLAARHPHLVRRLAVLDVPTRSAQAPDEVPERPYQFSDRDSAVRWERDANPAAPLWLVELIADHGLRAGSDGTLARKHDPLFASAWPFRAEVFDDDWRSVRCATLLVRADRSAVLDDRTFHAMLAANDQASGVVIERSGHLLPLEQPIALADALESFLHEDALDLEAFDFEREAIEIP